MSSGRGNINCPDLLTRGPVRAVGYSSETTAVNGRTTRLWHPVDIQKPEEMSPPRAIAMGIGCGSHKVREGKVTGKAEVLKSVLRGQRSLSRRGKSDGEKNQPQK